MVYTQEQINRLYKKISEDVAEEWERDPHEFKVSIAKIFDKECLINFPKWWDYVDEDIFRMWEGYTREYIWSKDEAITDSFDGWYIIGTICDKYHLDVAELGIHTDSETIINKYRELEKRYNQN